MTKRDAFGMLLAGPVFTGALFLHLYRLHGRALKAEAAAAHAQVAAFDLYITELRSHLIRLAPDLPEDDRCAVEATLAKATAKTEQGQ